MNDWLTLSLELSHIGCSHRAKLDGITDRVQRIDSTGELKWEQGCWDSLRSDMNGIAYCVGSSLRIGGSPASVVSPNNVFGSDDIRQCAYDMINFFEKHVGVILTKDLSKWKCTRADVTYNYDLGGQIAVNQALEYLRHANTRGMNVERRFNTVYWNKSSSLRSAKAYNKYLHALVMMRQQKAFFTGEEIRAIEGLLRLELKLGRHWFQRQDTPWYELTIDDFKQQHNNFFANAIGKIEVPTMDSLLDKLIEVTPTEGRARAAFDFFCRIKQLGYNTVKNTTPPGTFYKHCKFLRDAGLSNADLNAGRILEFRRKTIVLGEPVHSWDDLRRVG